MPSAIKLQLDKFAAKIKLVRKENKTYVWDLVRRKYVILKPEEMVRQLIIHYLVEELKYPKTSISIERQIKHQGASKRYDLIAYNSQFFPFILFEFKSFNVRLDDTTFIQSAIYNSQIKAEYLCITNGVEAYCYRIDQDNKSIYFCSELPTYR